MTYIKKVNNDIQYEAISIDNIKEYLEDHFKVKLNRTSQYHKFDLVSTDESFYFEIKSRRNKMSQYPTTMIPCGKIEYARKNIIPKNARAFFVFHFTDCLTLIEYTPLSFQSFEVKVGGRFDRCGPELNNYCYIPITSLLILPDYINV